MLNSFGEQAEKEYLRLGQDVEFAEGKDLEITHDKLD
jgi:hypothetical protein